MEYYTNLSSVNEKGYCEARNKQIFIWLRKLYFTTMAEVIVVAEDEEAAYELAREEDFESQLEDGMQGDGWDAEIIEGDD